jgi:hypothetical protein
MKKGPGPSVRLEGQVQTVSALKKKKVQTVSWYSTEYSSKQFIWFRVPSVPFGAVPRKPVTFSSSSLPTKPNLARSAQDQLPPTPKTRAARHGNAVGARIGRSRNRGFHGVTTPEFATAASQGKSPRRLSAPARVSSPAPSLVDRLASLQAGFNFSPPL